MKCPNCDGVGVDTGDLGPVCGRCGGTGVVDPLDSLHGIPEADMVGISGMENWTQDRSNRLVPTVVTVRQWFRMARASLWSGTATVPSVSLYFGTGDVRNPWDGPIHLRDIQDYNDFAAEQVITPRMQDSRYMDRVRRTDVTWGLTR